MATTLFFAVGFAAVAGVVAVAVAGVVAVVVAVVAVAGAVTPDSLSSSFSPSESQSAKKRNAFANPRTTSHIIHKSARSDAMINSMKRFQSIVTSSRIRYFYDMRTGASELRRA